MRLGYWLSLLLLIGLMWGYAQYRDLPGQHAKLLQSEKAVAELRAQLDSSRQEEQQLERIVRDLDRDPVEWEAAIRRLKGLVREGEKVYRIESAPLDAPGASKQGV